MLLTGDARIGESDCFIKVKTWYTHPPRWGFFAGYARLKYVLAARLSRVTLSVALRIGLQRASRLDRAFLCYCREDMWLYDFSVPSPFPPLHHLVALRCKVSIAVGASAAGSQGSILVVR